MVGEAIKQWDFSNRLAAATLSLGMLLSLTGCSVFGKSSAKGLGEKPIALEGSDSAEAFKRLKQAKSQNAIVLQIDGDSMPIRVLPLPPDGRPVFVSDLLKQTGIQEKMGRILVTVYRPADDGYSSARMDVRFDQSGEKVRPECDYSLRAGDRIRIVEDTNTGITSMLDSLLPSNASKAIIGR